MLKDCKLIGIVPTLDKARAKAFYHDTLGIEFVADDGFALVFKLPNAMLRVVPVQELTPQPFTLLGWEVTAIEDEVKALTDAGIVFERYSYFEQDTLGIWTAPNGNKVAWFKDPDGNNLSLSQH